MPSSLVVEHVPNPSIHSATRNLTKLPTLEFLQRLYHADMIHYSSLIPQRMRVRTEVKISDGELTFLVLSYSPKAHQRLLY